MGLFGRLIHSRTENTKTAFSIIIDDFKLYLLILKWVFLGFSFATVIYSLIVDVGTPWINYALLGVLVVYALLDTIFRLAERPNPPKKIRIVYAWIRILLNAVALVSSIYELYSATANEVKPITIVLVTLSLIMFILKVLAEILLSIIMSKWNLLKNAMIMDAKEHPKTSGKVFSPFIGDVEVVDAKESIVRRIKNRQSEKKNK